MNLPSHADLKPRGHRFAQYACPSCGYPLTGIPSVRCPECGLNLHRDQAESRREIGE